MTRVLRQGLSLAAAPTFALMALLNGIDASGNEHPLCSAAKAGLPWNGMATMYLVMSVFHLAPWLRLQQRSRGVEFATPRRFGKRPIT
jgi:hypothetical protein